MRSYRQGRVAFLPFTKVVRKASSGKPPPPATVGDYIRVRRCERKLPQRDVARQIGVSTDTIGNWENNRTEPPASFLPAIIRFIGFDPSPDPTTLAEQMRAYRGRHGLSIEQAARRAGVNRTSWGLWERTGLIPWKRYRTLVDEFLAQQVTAHVTPDDLVP